MVAGKKNLIEPQSMPSRWPALIFLGLVLMLVVGVRIRLIDFPLERDEGEFAYGGQLLLEGIPPYQAAVNMKMPGIYLAYAAIMSVFGQTPAGIHLGLLVIHLATLAVLFLIARKFFDLNGAAVATAAYGLMVLSPAYLGISAHATHFVMLPALLGMWLLFRVGRHGGLPGCLASGCLFGIGFLMKQPGLFFGVFGGLYLAWLSISSKASWQSLLMRLGIYSIGCLLPFLVACLWLKISGVFPQFWFWAITYPNAYADIVTFGAALNNAKIGFSSVFAAAPLLWVFSGIGLACLCLVKLPLNTKVFLGGFLLCSLLAVCPGFYFRGHYFIALAPAVALLAGLAMSCGCQHGAPGRTRFRMTWLFLFIAVVACAQSLQADRAFLFSLAPREACRAVYYTNPFPESLDVAEYIDQNTSPDQRIVVIGSEPQIYFYARRPAATSQTCLYPMMEPKPYARKLQEEMIRDIEQNPPEYLVLVTVPTSWLARPDSVLLLPEWVQGYVKTNMQRVGLIQYTQSQKPDAIWGPDAATAPLHSESYMAVYKKMAPQSPP